ncbi:WD40-repeat-containing domain protein [Phycomyces nitens]|nr:WD40-repeat-containing domain protein [Phycomyces nitens]
MNSLVQVDELVKEYLLFRGFTNTFRALETESRLDKDKGFQVDKIVEELIGYVVHGDVVYMLDYYRYLDVRFFSRLDSRFQRTVKKFELCLLRHYLVHAIQHKKKDKVIEFFDQFGPELHGKPEWSQWFALPYVKQPATDPTFETFFSKQWVDNYTISLHNFLATTFQNMPLPSLLSFNIERIQRKAQQAEIESLKSSVDNLKATVDARENEIAKLKHEVAETRREMTDGITLIRRRAASMTTDARVNGTKTKVGSQEKKNEKTIPKEAIIEIVPEQRDTVDKVNSMGDEEPFVIVSQEEFSEHASAITHAKFSTEGNLIASCDMDNIVRIWSYKGQSFNPLKVNNNTSNVLSMEWEARSDRFLFLGTDIGQIRVYNIETKSVVQEFTMDEKYPWVTKLSCSPVEPMFVCAGSSNKASADNTRDGVLVAWSMKTMAAIGTFRLDSNETCTDINTIKLNHNGQMLVAGDNDGFMKIFDVRSMKSIMEWKTSSGQPACMAQFSFDENSIYTVDHSGQLSQWSIHKPGDSLSNSSLQGFPPPAAFNSHKTTTHSDPFITSPTSATLPPTSLQSITANIAASPSLPATNILPPRPKSNPSTSSLSRLSISSNRSGRLPMITLDDSITQSLLSFSPRSQMVAFSADTEYVLCASSAFGRRTSNSPRPSSSTSSLFSMRSERNNYSSNSSSATSTNSGTTQGSIYQVSDGQTVLQFGQQPAYQKITTVDWTNSSNACLLGNTDGSVKVTNLIKV